jgi:hypothetical protein
MLDTPQPCHNRVQLPVRAERLRLDVKVRSDVYNTLSIVQPGSRDLCQSRQVRIVCRYAGRVSCLKLVWGDHALASRDSHNLWGSIHCLYS